MDPDSLNSRAGVIRLDEEEIRPGLSQALAALGYPPDHAPPAPVPDHVERALHLAGRAVDPRASVRFARLEFSRGEQPGFRLPAGPAFSTRLVSRVLSRAACWAFFAVTLGEAASELSAKHREEGLLLSFCVDAVASLYAENLANRLQERLSRDLAKPGLVPGYRYSPGYCDWPHSDIRALAEVVEAHRIGIRLTEGGMMVPEKSVSGIMGFGLPDSGVLESPCRQCGKPTCPHRREAKNPPRA